MNVLGIQLNAPSLMGLLRMLGFTLCAVALVEIADSLNSGVWANEGSLSFIVGGFSGFPVERVGCRLCKARLASVCPTDGLRDLRVLGLQPDALSSPTRRPHCCGPQFQSELR